MKTKFKFILIIPFLYISSNLYSYEIVRDPIFEDYFEKICNKFKLDNIDVYLIKNQSANAFVIKNNIYFTTSLLQKINNEDTLLAIFFHEYGHIINNHYESKNVKIKQSSNINTFYNLFSLGLAVLTTNTNIAIGASVTLNSNLVNDISKHSVNFEIEADNYMIEQIKKNKINTSELITFLSSSSSPSYSYFKSHPNNQDRINNIKNLNYKKSINSKKFEWIKSKYSKSSSNEKFNIFFENLEKGIFHQDENFNNIDTLFVKYEVFKKVFSLKIGQMIFRNYYISMITPF